jgi:DNA-binding transcriptional LysR family regulator
LAVAKAKSYSRAAANLGMSQPTVGRNVKRLQDVIGTQLVVPTKTGILLTEEGEILARSLIEVDQRLLTISSGVKSERSGIEGSVRISITEGLAGMFVIPNIKRLTATYPKIKVLLKNPVNMGAFKDNQCDIMIGFANLESAEMTTIPLGFLHFLPIVTQEYIRQHGIPTKDTVEKHFFVDSDFYRGGQKIWADWHDLVKRGTVQHMSEGSFSYALMVRFGLGIGLLGTYALSDPTTVPLDLGVEVRVPVFAYALKDRLSSKAVQIVFEWLCDIFGAHNPLFAPETNLTDIPRHDLSRVISKLFDWPKFPD